ncbi:cytochrome b/b6 domain-containing protein [Porphyrobacter sp. MBR-155]|uniref:cytochrome b/b6 domain-containing protein n=1 Tax=Porphyrobacter sp. MBR-155 TaxID=3156464 RepID=UPI0033936EC4
MAQARKAMAHLREIRTGQSSQHASHNPLGAFMVYSIWGCLLTIIATGIAMAGVPPISLADNEVEQRGATELVSSDQHSEEHNEGGEEGEGLLGEVHETAANLLYLLILLHLAGVLFETRRSGRQVLVAMLPLQR